MPEIFKIRMLLVTLLVTCFLIVSVLPLNADEEIESSEEEAERTVIEKGDPDIFNIEDIIDESGEDILLGIVDGIEITGSFWVKQTVIIRQMTFKIGEEISQSDLDLSKRRILQLNGLFWYADFEVLPAEEDGHINLKLDVNMRRTYYIHPAQSGAGAGDRN